MNHYVGRAGVHYVSIVSSWNSVSNTSDPELRAEIYLDGKNCKAIFDMLLQQKEDIEADMTSGLFNIRCFKLSTLFPSA